MIRERRRAHLITWLVLPPLLAGVIAAALALAPPRPAEPAADAPGAEAS
jgi:hypothetical protein